MSSHVDETNISAVVQHWLDDSNGKYDIFVYTADEDVTEPGPLHTFLKKKLPKDVLDIKASKPPTEADYGDFESAARSSGAYSQPPPVDIQKLRANRSIAAMAGVAEKATAKLTGEAAEAAGCKFFVGDREGKYFYQIAWDEFIICVRGDKRTVVVFVASDTD